VKNAAPRYFMMALPYVCVLVGLDLFRSAWLTILLYHSGIVLFLAMARPAGLRERLLTGWRPGRGIALALLGACSGPLLLILWPAIADDPGGLSSTLAGFGLRGINWWLFAVYYVTLHPVLEEAFWRDTRFSPQSGLALSDVAFAGYHLLVVLHFLRVPWSLVTVAVLVFVAWLWRQIARRCQGLAIPLVSHAVAGLSTMAAVSFLVHH
jgi:hypothetical protein